MRLRSFAHSLELEPSLIHCSIISLQEKEELRYFHCELSYVISTIVVRIHHGRLTEKEEHRSQLQSHFGRVVRKTGSHCPRGVYDDKKTTNRNKQLR